MNNAKYFRQIVLIAFFFLSFSSFSFGAPKPSAAAIASAHPLATAAGEDILRQGGNAFDAAIAVSAALAVVEPAGSGLGGGGFYLLYEAEKDRSIMLDARETAPQAAHRDMYLDKNGEPIKNASTDGPLAAGIPGIPAALAHLAERYGKLPLPASLAPAILYAKDGFAIEQGYITKMQWRLEAVQKFDSAAAIFLDQGQLPQAGWKLVQPDLAQTLSTLAQHGAKGFYEGKVAQSLVEGSKQHGGVWTREDLQNYRIVERDPIRSSYRGITLVSAPPPSSGGIALATMLNILQNYDLGKVSDATRVHLISEAMRRAYRDRAEYLGDPDFVRVPVERLIHPLYAAGLSASIRPDRATPSSALPMATSPQQGSDTTHFSILDKDGNLVAATLSVNLPFGSGFVPAGTGVLLNNEMDDFSIKPGAPNSYGLVGNEANAIAPGKRPLSSMTPTFLETSDRVGILGTPGGSRIITMVLLSTLAFAEGRPVVDWVTVPRFHHQFLPDEIQFEEGTFSPELQSELQALGHTLKPISRRYGDMQVVLWDKKSNEVSAATDPRGEGKTGIIDD